MMVVVDGCYSGVLLSKAQKNLSRPEWARLKAKLAMQASTKPTRISGGGRYAGEASVLTRWFVSNEALDLHGTTRVDWPVGGAPKTPKLSGEEGTQQIAKRQEFCFWDPAEPETPVHSIWRVLESAQHVLGRQGISFFRMGK